VELDPRDYQIALGIAEARQLGAKAARQLAQLNHERDLKLFADNLISQTVADHSAAALAQASADVDSASAQVDRAKRDLERTNDPPLAVELRDAVRRAPEPAWPAKIIRTEGAVDENSLDLFAIARVEDPFGIKSGHPPLRIGQPLTASIAGKTLTNVVALPRGAVRQLDQVVLVQRTS